MSAGAAPVKLLNLDNYQNDAAKSDRNPAIGTAGIHFALLGLFGEVGSLLSELKKKQRDTDSYYAYQTSVIEELGDVIWYLSSIARRANLTLSTLALRASRDLANWDEPSGKSPLTFEELQAGVQFTGPLSNSEAETGLIILAGKTGRLLDEVAAGRVDGNRDVLSAQLVEVFRALIHAANNAGVSLTECAQSNLNKVNGRWPDAQVFASLFDEEDDPEEQLPRHIEIDVRERKTGTKTYVRLQRNGVNIGDRLTDNKEVEDDYRFHDVFHLANAAILGWSPVVRALFKVKRKSKPLVDEVQDGARAVLIEEGIATWVFNHARRLNYFESIKSLDYSLLKAIRQLVEGYEVESVPLWQWEKAILDGYAVFRSLREHRGGLIVADLIGRSISFRRT